jgi:hypothetical protein
LNYPARHKHDFVSLRGAVPPMEQCAKCRCEMRKDATGKPFIYRAKSSDKFRRTWLPCRPEEQAA